MSPTERLLVLRAVRGVSLIAIFTGGAIYSIHGNVSRPHGSPLLYAIAMSWLISITVALPTSAFFRVNQSKTPRYNYNQVMYRLRLDDPRLKPAQP